METRHAQVISCAPGRGLVEDAPGPAWAGRESPVAPRVPVLPLARRRQPVESAPAVAIAAPATAAPAAAPSLPAVKVAASPASVTTGATVPAGTLRDHLVREIGAEMYERYFDRATRLSLGAKGLEVGVPSRFMADLLGRRFGEKLRNAVRAHTGGDAEVSFCVDSFRADSEAPAERGNDAPAGRRDRSGGRAGGRSSVAVESGPAEPKPRARRRSATAPTSWYSLEDFVVGTSNKLAYEAAVRLAEDTSNSTSKLSPLFIHGACGLGKTHLLQGIARRFKERNPGAIIRYTTGEAFTNEFIGAVREGRVGGVGGGVSGGAAGGGGGGGSGGGGDRFRRLYRNVDLLCIDDVHFLANKQATQAELLHTFDAVGLGGARVVLASDGPPRQIRRFSDALVSRFLSGMVVGLGTPERALRERIIRLFASRRGLPIDDAGVRAIADHADDATVSLPGQAAPPEVSIRELEGLVTRVEAVWRLLPQGSVGGDEAGTIGRIVVERALGPAPGGENGSAPRRLARPIRVDHIIATICHHLGIVGTDFAGRGRHPRVVLARAVVVVLARRLTTASYPEIARAMGRPNHSTVITAFNRLMEQIKADAPCPLDGEYAGLTIAQLCDRFASEVARTA